MKKAEQNMRKVFEDYFNKNEKDTEVSKKQATDFNAQMLHNIKEIKENLIQRLKNREMMEA